MSHSSNRPLHLRPRYWALVGAGGAVGTALRAGIAHAVPTDPGTWPWATLTVNLVGAFVLPALLEVIAGLQHRFVAWRLTLGTGLLGGFTTYSAFAVESVGLLRAGRAGLALAYVALTVLGGFMLAMLSPSGASRAIHHARQTR